MPALLLIPLLLACAGKSEDSAPDAESDADADADTDADTDADVVEAELAADEVTAYGDALADQVAAGDGAGIDAYFRNSGVVVDEAAGTYFGVNGVHPVNAGDYGSYYPKSIVEASLADDSLVRAYAFSAVNGHDVDMEALTFAGPTDLLYVGDEYNYVYELDLDSGEVTREWDLGDVGISTAIDKGIEALDYSAAAGLFYAGIQAEERIYALDLSLEGGETLSEEGSFSLPAGWAPSGLFAHSDGTLYVVAMSNAGTAGDQRIYRYSAEGELLCDLTIPESLGIVRPDGIFIDAADENVYIADSQGPIYGGSSMYKIRWNDQCN